MDVTFDMFAAVIAVSAIYYAIMAIVNRKRASEE